MKRIIGHSLWLVPSDPLNEPLATSIQSLARGLGGPVFDPHVTLLGELPAPRPEIVAATKRWAAGVAPLRFEVESVKTQEDYFQALYLSLEAGPRELEAFKRAQDIFAVKGAVWKPHLSLYYGERGETVKGKMLPSLEMFVGKTLSIQSVIVFFTEGPEENWHPVAEFSLVGSP